MLTFKSLRCHDGWRCGHQRTFDRQRPEHDDFSGRRNTVLVGSAVLIPSPAAGVEDLTSILGAPWFLSALIDPTHPTHPAYMIYVVRPCRLSSSIDRYLSLSRYGLELAFNYRVCFCDPAFRNNRSLSRNLTPSGT